MYSKGYTTNWNRELFKIHKINSTHPVTYTLEDENKEIIQGKYYEQELLRSIFNFDSNNKTLESMNNFPQNGVRFQQFSHNFLLLMNSIISDSVDTSMFSLKSKYTLDKPIHKIDFIKYSPSSLATINNNNSNISISLPREDAYICLQNSYISLEFEVLKNDNTRYANGDEISLVNFGLVVLFSEAKLTTSRGKHLEKVANFYPICLMYKLLTSSQQTSQLMYGFEESTTIRRQELTNIKTEEGTFFVRIKLKDLFGFADEEKIIYGLGYTLTLK